MTAPVEDGRQQTSDSEKSRDAKNVEETRRLVEGPEGVAAVARSEPVSVVSVIP
jgi:hypothetical protein